MDSFIALAGGGRVRAHSYNTPTANESMGWGDSATKSYSRLINFRKYSAFIKAKKTEGKPSVFVVTVA